MIYIKKYLIDTNALINNPSTIDTFENVVIPYPVLDELDKIKTEQSERGFKARDAVRKLKQENKKVEYIIYDKEKFSFLKFLKNLFKSKVNFKSKNDDLILNVAKKHGFTLVTGDFLLQLKAKALDVEVFDAFEIKDSNEYKGYIDLVLDDEQMAFFYENKDRNIYDLLPNQFLIIRNLGNEIKSVFKWDGVTYVGIEEKKTISSNVLGKFKPKDIYQKLLVDSLLNNQVTMIKGKAGSGKSLAALSYSMSMIESGKRYNKLICFVNPMASRNSAKLGFYPGTRNEKLLDSAVGSMLSSKFGDRFQLESLIEDGTITLLPFSDIRGFDTTGMKAIVYIIEAQNLDVDLMKLAIQRVGEDSKLIIDGDYHAQVDSSYYEGSNNGMRRASEIFRGEEYYGEVELPNIYRSRMAAKADEM